MTETGGPPAAEPDEGSGAAAGRRRDDDVSWLGCVWLIIVPGIIFAAVVITLNWLGC